MDSSFIVYGYKITREKIIIIFSVLLFALVSGYNVTTPGFYYDELLFVNAARGGHINMFIHYRIGDLPVMLMPYIGALKAWIYYPIFKIFGVSAYSVRYPVIIIGCITLWINFKFMKLAFSSKAAIVFLVLAAIEPSTLFHTRLDWGPTALMMLFRALLLLSVFTWIKTKNPWQLLVVCLVIALGTFDKLNFIWSVVAIVVSAVVVYPTHIYEFIRAHRRSSTTAAVVGALSLLLFYFYTQSSMDIDSQFVTSNWWQRLQYVINMFRSTVSGAGVYDVVVGDDQIVDPAKYQLITLGFATLLALVLLFRKREDHVWRPLIFVLVFTIMILIQIFVTRQATGPHHMAMIAPLWLMPLSVLLGSVFDRAHSHKKYLLRTLSAIAIVGVFLSSSLVDATYLKGFNGTVKHSWDVSSGKLVTVLESMLGSKTNRPVVCVDWGLGTIIYALLDDKVNIQDNWPWFKDGFTDSQAKYYEREIVNKNPIIIVPAKGMEAFPEARENFFKIASRRRWELSRPYVIMRGNGDAIYEVYTINNYSLIHNK